MFLLRLLLITLLLALLLLPAGAALLLFQGLQDSPLVPATSSPGQEDVARIKVLVREHDPRQLRDGETRTVSLSQRDLNLGLKVALPLAERQRARVNLAAGLGTVHYTLQIPQSPLDDYLNLTLWISEHQGQPRLDRGQLGDIGLPGWSLTPLVSIADQLLRERFSEYSGAREALREVSIEPGEIGFTYRWDQALAKQIEQRGREVFLPPADRDRAIAYYQVLAKVSHQVGSSASLDTLLQPLFNAAIRRSEDGDPAAENRALLLVLGTVLNRSSMHRLVGGNPADLTPGHRYVKWTLHKRGDLAQHFGISAAIAAAGGGTLADAVGVFKELDDSRGGSGFSFPDLLADRAGVELSATATGTSAKHLQISMASNGLNEADFMPPIDNLPEGLMEMEFKQRYRDLDDARYAYVKREIETRIRLLPIYR